MGHSKSRPARLSELYRCSERWAELFNAGQLSVPDDIGEAYILYSVHDGGDKALLRKHADALTAQWRSRRGGRAIIEVTCNPTVGDVEFVIQNHAVSTLAFIGHGSLGAWWRYDSKVHSPMTWYQLAALTTHLKRGIVEQRTCASAPDLRSVRLPIGTFLVTDQRNAIAPVGHSPSNKAGFDEFEKILGSVYDHAVNAPMDLIANVQARLQAAQDEAK